MFVKVIFNHRLKNVVSWSSNFQELEKVAVPLTLHGLCPFLTTYFYIIKTRGHMNLNLSGVRQCDSTTNCTKM